MTVQDLVIRIPLTSVARLLIAHQFTSVLRKTLGWLQRQVHRVAVSPDVEFGIQELFDSPEESSDTAESSSGGPRTPKKRKLDGTEVTASREAVSTATGAFRIVYLAICRTVSQLQVLTMGPEQTHGFAVEHMKSSLRSSPEDAAHILGSSFYLTNRLIQTTPGYFHRKKVFTRELQQLLANTGYSSCIIPAIDLWNQRSHARQQSSSSGSVRNLQNNIDNRANIILLRAHSWLVVCSPFFSSLIHADNVRHRMRKCQR